jgi:hypothetical protein
MEFSRKENRLSRRLVSYALSGYYYFDNDKIENMMVDLLKRHKNRPDCQSLVASHVADKFRPEIVKLAKGMGNFGKFHFGPLVNAGNE